MLTPAMPSPPSGSPSTPCGQTSRATLPGPDRPTAPGAADVADGLAWLTSRAEAAVGRWAAACERVAGRLAPAAAGAPEVC